MEVLGYYKLSSDEIKAFELFFQSINVIEVSNAVIEIAVTLRQQKKTSPGDSIIAGTAFIQNQKIFTNNEDDFRDIPGLEIIPMSSI